MTQKANVMLKMEAANKLLDYAASLSNYEEMLNFQNKFKALIKEYGKSPYAFLSTGIYLERLDGFKNWLPELVANKEKLVPLLVSNMLKGDMFAESIYKGIYQHLDRFDLVLSIYEVLDTPSLESRYSENGGSGGALAKMNAEQWLVSQEAAEVFDANHQGNAALCYVGELLGIHNNYVDCEVKTF